MLLNIDGQLLNEVYFNETVANYLWFAGIIVGTLLLKKPLAAVLTRISSRLASRFSYIKHKAEIRELLFKPVERLLMVILCFVASERIAGLLNSINLHRTAPRKGNNVIVNLGDLSDHVFLLLFIICFTLLITRIIDFVYYVRMGRAREEKNMSRQQMFPLIKEMSKLLTWTLSVFWILGSVFHVNIPALITGLGIGGVAIALAGKETVENFFAAFTILSDRPFIVGDVIKLGEIEGVVERIGFRSTRLRNADGSAFIIPNQNLVSQSLVNHSARETRGMKITANIRYGITPEVMAQMIAEIKETLHNTPPVKEPITALVESFEKETILLLVNYHLPHPLPEGKTLLALKHDINLKVLEIISKHAKLGAPPEKE